MKKTIILLVGVLGLVCSGASQDEVLIRIANHGKVELQNVVVQFPTQKEKYGNILPGKETSYRKVDKAYGYAYIRALVEGKEAVLQPEDYVGETLLKPGMYTYVLTYNPDSVDKHDRLNHKLTEE